MADSEDTRNLNLSTLKIIGAPKESKFPSVCDIRISYKGSSFLRNFSSRCSGVLVSPTLVLTAAHSFAGKLKEVRYVVCKFKTEEATTLVRVSRKVHIPKGFKLSQIEQGKEYQRARGSTLDYALIELAKPITSIVPAPMLPFEILEKRHSEGVLEQFKAVGFGAYSFENSRKEQDAKRSFDFTFEIYRNLKAFKVFPPKRKAATGETISTHFGDSGGAYFVNIGGVEYLVGLISSVTMAREAEFENTALYSVGLSIDNPYRGFHRYFKDLKQDVGILGYGYTKDLPKIKPKLPNVGLDALARNSKKHTPVEASTASVLIGPALVLSTLVSLSYIVKKT